LLLTSCPQTENIAITIKNNSNEDIVWMLCLERLGDWNETNNINSWLENDMYIIKRGKTYIEFRFSSDALKTNLEMGWIKYCLFNYDSLKTIPWERICAERIIQKEVTFYTLEDFERCNFEITYP